MFGADRQAALPAEPGNVGCARVGTADDRRGVPGGGSPAPVRSPVRNSGDAVAPCCALAFALRRGTSAPPCCSVAGSYRASASALSTGRVLLTLLGPTDV